MLRRQNVISVIGRYSRNASLAFNRNFILSKVSNQKIKLENYDFLKDGEALGGSIPSSLPFEQRRNSESFGQLVTNDLNNQGSDQIVVKQPTVQEVVDQSDANQPIVQDKSPFRNDDGSYIKGENAAEARLHDLTLEGRVDHKIVKLPHEVALAINNNILRLAVPDRLRERSALIYQSLTKDQIQKAPESALDCDAHIASLFIQNYSHAHQVLKELQSRVGRDKFNPQRVLDIGYGPATGIVALNEIMGDEWVPIEKEAYIVGRNNYEMKKRAKIILSRQLNENFEQEVDETENAPTQTSENEVGENEVSENEVSENNPTHASETEVNENDPAHGSETEVGEAESTQTSETEPTNITLQANETELEDLESDLQDSPEEQEHIGPIRTGDITIRTRLRDSLPSTKKYDLIIVNQSLLTREFNFPKDIDTNMHLILRLLNPGGHLLLIERGNSLGFETVARARQIMIRPESYETEHGKIPRPYIKGSSIKPQRLKKEDQLISDEDLEYERNLYEEYEELDREEALQEKLERGETIEDVSQISDSEKALLKELEEEGSKFEHELNEKFGEPTEEEMRFDGEGTEELEVLPLDHTEAELGSESVDYHISIIAPCPHHRKCPLQLGDPKYYKIPSHKHRLNFCSFNKVVERPRFTMELKKGRRLATSWDKGSDDGFGIKGMSKKSLKKLEGSGRPGGNNTESGSYSYLIAQRSLNDVASIQNIEKEREFHTYDHPSDTGISTWPRILDNPAKIKNNVKLNVCAPSGNVETWQIPKSLGKQEYHDARKVDSGDLWALGKKSVQIRSNLSEDVREKLEVLHKTQRKTFLKEQSRKKWKKVTSRSELDFEGQAYTLADSIAAEMERSKKYRTKGKKAKFDVDPRSFDGQ